MKKVFNWLGFIVCTIYLIIGMFFAALSYYMAFSGRYEVDIITYPVTIAMILFLFMFFLFPIFWNKTFYFVLPTQSNYATLMSKERRALTKYARGLLFAKEIYVVTFRLSNGDQKTFCVATSQISNLLYTIPKEKGHLCYKEQGKHL